MESIDVRDLPEDQAQLVAAFVEFLRLKLYTSRTVTEAEGEEQGWDAAAVTSFAKDWDNEQDAIYDNWKERYDVPEG
ncbi:MAG: hypothetical protein ACRERE_20975 [Candidatus Entotheonellia bacterium]